MAIGLRNWEQDPRTFTCLTCSCVRARACMQEGMHFGGLLFSLAMVTKPYPTAKHRP